MSRGGSFPGAVIYLRCYDTVAKALHSDTSACLPLEGQRCYGNPMRYHAKYWNASNGSVIGRWQL